MSGVPHRMCRMPQKISLVCLFFFHALRFEKMGGSAFCFEGFALGLPRTFCFAGFALGLPRTLSWFSFVLVHKRMGGSAAPILSAHHHSASGVRSSAIGYRLSAIGYRLSAIGYRPRNTGRFQWPNGIALKRVNQTDLKHIFLSANGATL